MIIHEAQMWVRTDDQPNGQRWFWGQKILTSLPFKKFEATGPHDQIKRTKNLGPDAMGYVNNFALSGSLDTELDARTLKQMFYEEGYSRKHQ